MVTATTEDLLKISRLTQRELDLMTGIFLQHPDIKRVVLFGSRAKGTAKPYSDIDLAVEGMEKERDIAAVAMELDDLPLPYKFDVKSLDSLQHSPLQEHIQRVGITIYLKGRK